MKGTFICALLLFLAQAIIAQVVDFSKPPPGGVWDPDRFLDEDYRRNIEARIDNEKVTKNFELYVIMFAEEPATGAKAVARQAGEKWSTGHYWAVIYQVGAEGMPECVTGGRTMKHLNPKMVEDRVSSGKRLAWMVSTRQERMEEMVNRMAAGLGFLKQEASRNEERQVELNLKRQRDAKEAKFRLYMRSLIVGFLALVALGVGFFIWRKAHYEKRPLEFPRTSPRKRLMAPHSGGGNVQVSYGERKKF